jgi:hypothetical protein
MGNVVLTLPSDHSACSVLARRGSTTQAESEFVQLVKKPPPRFLSELKTDEHSSTPANGKIHTLGYVWKMDSNPKTLAFFLTAADSPSASVQLKATLTKVSAP